MLPPKEFNVWKMTAFTSKPLTATFSVVGKDKAFIGVNSTGDISKLEFLNTVTHAMAGEIMRECIEQMLAVFNVPNVDPLQAFAMIEKAKGLLELIDGQIQYNEGVCAHDKRTS
jgi:hypothetical protein